MDTGKKKTWFLTVVLMVWGPIIADRNRLATSNWKIAESAVNKFKMNKYEINI